MVFLGSKTRATGDIAPAEAITIAELRQRSTILLVSELKRTFSILKLISANESDGTGTHLIILSFELYFLASLINEESKLLFSEGDIVGLYSVLTLTSLISLELLNLILAVHPLKNISKNKKGYL